MKKLLSFGAASLVISAMPVVTSLPSVGAQTGSSIDLINAAAYSADSDYLGTFCVDGVMVEGPNNADGTFSTTDWVEQTWTAGSHLVEFFTLFNPDCTGEPTAAETIDVTDGDDLAVVLIWGDEGREFVVWDNSDTCLNSNEARLTVRHGQSDFIEPLSTFSDDGGNQLLAGGVEGEQLSVVIAAPVTLPDVDFRIDAESETYATLGDYVAEPGVETFAYLYAGSDGPVGVFSYTRNVACNTPTTTTTALAPTTTTTAAPPQNIPVIRPTFAG